MKNNTVHPLALVTGASGGIGEEIARELARRGYDIILVSRDQKKLTGLAFDLAHNFKSECFIIPCDLSKTAAADTLFAKVKKLNRPVELLVNNAGFGLVGAFEKLDLKRESEMILLNVSALHALTKLFFREMIRRKSGRILNVASVAAFIPGPFAAVYYASKAFVLSLSKALWQEGRPHGVSVTALCPGPVATGFQKRAGVKLMPLQAIIGTSARRVAKSGVRAVLKGRRQVIPGLLNRIIIFLSKISPERLALASVERTQKKR